MCNCPIDTRGERHWLRLPMNADIVSSARLQAQVAETQAPCTLCKVFQYGGSCHWSSISARKSSWPRESNPCRLPLSTKLACFRIEIKASLGSFKDFYRMLTIWQMKQQCHFLSCAR